MDGEPIMSLPKTRDELNPYPRNSNEWHIWNDGYTNGQRSTKRQVAIRALGKDQ